MLSSRNASVPHKESPAEAELFSMKSVRNQRLSDLAYYEGLGRYWDESLGTNLDKLRSFPKFVPTGDLAKFLARYEIWKKVVNVHGAII